jgi:hypothetical protein
LSCISFESSMMGYPLLPRAWTELFTLSVRPRGNARHEVVQGNQRAARATCPFPSTSSPAQVVLCSGAVEHQIDDSIATVESTVTR